MIARAGDNLFAKQSGTASFDEIAIAVDLVRAVNSEMNPVDLLKRDQRHAETGRELAGLFARLDTAHEQAVGNFVGQHLDEILGRGAGAETDGHAILDVFHCCQGSVFLLVLVGHAGSVLLFHRGLLGTLSGTEADCPAFAFDELATCHRQRIGLDILGDDTARPDNGALANFDWRDKG